MRDAAHAACRRTGGSRRGTCACRFRRSRTSELASPPHPAPGPEPGTVAPRLRPGRSSPLRGQPSSSHFRELDPPTLRRRALHRLADRLYARALRQVRVPRPCRPALEQVGGLVDERHAVADSLPDRPPVRGVRMSRRLGTNAPHPVEPAVVVGIAVPELVQARIVETQGTPTSVDLDGEVAWTAGTDAGHFEGPASAAREADERRGRLVDVDRPA